MSLPLRPPNFVVDTLLPQGLHILAGSPKVGKSWLALWLAVTVAKGEQIWNMTTKQGTTLYLCLEDSVLRIQNRLFEITEDAPDSVHFCTECAPIGQGLEEQVEEFLAQHSDTVLMILAGLLLLWLAWGGGWSKLSLLLPQGMPPPRLPTPTEKPGADNRKRKSPWDTRRMIMRINPHGNHPYEYFSGEQRKMLDRR